MLGWDWFGFFKSPKFVLEWQFQQQTDNIENTNVMHTIIFLLTGREEPHHRIITRHKTVQWQREKIPPPGTALSVTLFYYRIYRFSTMAPHTSLLVFNFWQTRTFIHTYTHTPTHTHLRLFIVALWDLIVGNVDEAHLPLLLPQLRVKDLKWKTIQFTSTSQSEQHRAGNTQSRLYHQTSGQKFYIIALLTWY